MAKSIMSGQRKCIFAAVAFLFGVLVPLGFYTMTVRTPKVVVINPDFQPTPNVLTATIHQQPRVDYVNKSAATSEITSDVRPLDDSSTQSSGDSDAKRAGESDTKTAPSLPADTLSVPLPNGSNVQIDLLDIISRPESPSFEILGPADNPLFVYSALYDKDNVRIVLLKLRAKSPGRLQCAVFDTSGGGQPAYKDVHTKDLQEHHSAKFTAAYLKCPWKPVSNQTGRHVVVLAQGDKQNNVVILPVEGFAPLGEKKESAGIDKTGGGANDAALVEFTVCVPPMYGNFSGVEQLIEKLEMVRLLGAGRIMLFNMSINPVVDATLRWYIEEGKKNLKDEDGRAPLDVIVKHWKLPIFPGENPPWKPIHYFGQLAAIDDCLSRYRWRTDYMVFNDMDELIIPRVHSNWSELITERHKFSPSKSSFMFHCTIFRTDTPVSPEQGYEDDAEKSVVLGRTKRIDYIFPKSDRSKMIVDPKKVEEMGIHFVWVPRNQFDDIPKDVGLLNHYRKPVKIKDEHPLIDDPTAAKNYGPRLSKRLHFVYGELSKAGIIPV